MTKGNKRRKKREDGAWKLLYYQDKRPKRKKKTGKKRKDHKMIGNKHISRMYRFRDPVIKQKEICYIYNNY